MKGTLNLQDTFLNQARKENMLTTVFLVNGYQIKGVVRSFDNFTVLLEVD
ncbi:MAG: RNA chaperone Hfq, partial [Dethiobacter sp.]|nr:RNA chaperone Hfq [Dethiobacter sp.]